jgi:N,N'-diacetylbacillosaminyl-diphospho-undecaprenol alpha-1,3-N-acetylgalactosaminyltransferase
MNKRTTIVITSPDALSVVLFCTRIIAEFQRIPGARIIVICKSDAFRDRLASLGVEVQDIAFYRHFSVGRDWSYLLELRSRLKAARADIVLNMTTKPLVYGALAAKLAGVPYVISYNVGLGKGFLDSAGLRQAVIRNALRLLYWTAYRLSDRDWFTNGPDFEQLVQRGTVSPAKAFVTKFYLDTDYYSAAAISSEATAEFRRAQSIPSESVVVSMVARLIWPKGIREFVDAAEAVTRRYPGTCFVLVAPEERGSDGAVPLDYIEAACRRNPSFRWINFMNDPRLLYAASDVSVLPSFYPEGGFPRALTEPMSMGRPVVTTDNPSCSGTVEPGVNGTIVPMQDSARLAAAVEALVVDPNLRRRFGENSRAKALRDFDEKTIVPAAFRQLGLEAFGWRAGT